MSEVNGRVTNSQLYAELNKIRDDVPSRRELRLTVGLAVVGGNAVSAFIGAYAAREPAVHATVSHILALF